MDSGPAGAGSAFGARGFAVFWANSGSLGRFVGSVRMGSLGAFDVELAVVHAILVTRGAALYSLAVVRRAALLPFGVWQFVALGCVWKSGKLPNSPCAW
jgi:hypothetical protein